MKCLLIFVDDVLMGADDGYYERLQKISNEESIEKIKTNGVYCDNEGDSSECVLDGIKVDVLDRLTREGCTELLHEVNYDVMSNGEDELEFREKYHWERLMNLVSFNSKMWESKWKKMKLKVLMFEEEYKNFQKKKLKKNVNVSFEAIKGGYLSKSIEENELFDVVEKCMKKYFESLECEEGDDALIVLDLFSMLNSSVSLKKRFMRIANELVERFHYKEQNTQENLYQLVVAGNRIEKPDKYHQDKNVLKETLTKKFAFIPEQSYYEKLDDTEQKGGNINDKCSLIAVHHCYETTRIDKNAKFEEKGCMKNAGYGRININHLVNQMAYRLGFSPKYGA